MHVLHLAASFQCLAWSCTRHVSVTVCSESPADPVHGNFDCGTSTLPGGSCAATCREGYMGSPVATCTADGTWSAFDGSCQLIGEYLHNLLPCQRLYCAPQALFITRCPVHICTAQACRVWNLLCFKHSDFVCFFCSLLGQSNQPTTQCF